MSRLYYQTKNWPQITLKSSKEPRMQIINSATENHIEKTWKNLDACGRYGHRTIWAKTQDVIRHLSGHEIITLEWRNQSIVGRRELSLVRLVFLRYS